jgi:hypothetical protein
MLCTTRTRDVNKSGAWVGLRTSTQTGQYILLRDRVVSVT